MFNVHKLLFINWVYVFIINFSMFILTYIINIVVHKCMYNFIFYNIKYMYIYMVMYFYFNLLVITNKNIGYKSFTSERRAIKIYVTFVNIFFDPPLYKNGENIGGK